MGDKEYYEKLGLKVGLEIHQQLNTKQKLFCQCPTRLVEREIRDTIIRTLRPSRSELGEIDPAALFEYMKHKRYVYEIPEEASCLVELDEEPPHDLNQEALDIVIQIALMLRAKLVNEIHVMRKIVIDGSNTTGFQRTAIVAMNGMVEDEDGEIGIKTICLEEEAARKISEDEAKIVYRLDRLGIPLVEIATSPNIKTPQQARRIALRIGRILRATGKVKRGIGTIRQDLNISISGGARIEVKGVQDLNQIPKIIEYEIMRQQKLLEIRDKLIERGVKVEELMGEYMDVTEIFTNTNSKLVRDKLIHGKRVYAVKLRKFAGLVGMEIQPNRRLATEFLERAKLVSGIGGLIHTDELPKYGITLEEVMKLKNFMQAAENDAIVMVIDDADKCKTALNAIIQRAREAIISVPEETRAANDDGTTRYSRPMPGPARMYPETDIRPIQITEEYINKVKEKLPEPPEERIKRYVKMYGLNLKLAEDLIDSEREEIFEKIIRGLKVNATLVASTLTYTMNMLKNEGLPIDNIPQDAIIELFRCIANGEMAKEAIPEVLRELSQKPDLNMREVIRKLGKESIGIKELEGIIVEEMEKISEIIEEKGMGAMGLLMGRVMSIVRGRIDGKIVNEVVKRKLMERLGL